MYFYVIGDVDDRYDDNSFKNDNEDKNDEDDNDQYWKHVSMNRQDFGVLFFWKSYEICGIPSVTSHIEVL